MSKRTILVSVGAVAFIAAVAAGLAFFLLRSDGAAPVSSAPGRPTSSIGRPSNTVVEALGQARTVFTSAPPFVVHDIQSVTYVDTTAGRARDLFDPERKTPSDRWIAAAADDAAAWVVVAYGNFQVKSVPGSDTPGPWYSTVWVVVPKGGESELAWSHSDQRYDLTRLGTPVEVPVPLPPFPEPVTLDSP